MNSDLAPALPDTLQWLNAPATTLHEQRGRVVALVFVNAASAWSWQRLRDVAQLQTRYPGRLQPIAVHVPRFESERDPRHVLKQLRRQGVTFPIAHDADWHAWQRFDVQAWPTVQPVSYTHLDVYKRQCMWHAGPCWPVRVKSGWPQMTNASAPR